MLSGPLPISGDPFRIVFRDLRTMLTFHTDRFPGDSNDARELEPSLALRLGSRSRLQQTGVTPLPMPGRDRRDA